MGSAGVPIRYPGDRHWAGLSDLAAVGVDHFFTFILPDVGTGLFIDHSLLRGFLPPVVGLGRWDSGGPG
jgi:hypothetical protein